MEIVTLANHEQVFIEDPLCAKRLLIYTFKILSQLVNCADFLLLLASLVGFHLNLAKTSDHMVNINTYCIDCFHT